MPLAHLVTGPPHHAVQKIVGANAEEVKQNRVILLSDGVATAGITSDAKALSLATAWASLRNRSESSASCMMLAAITLRATLRSRSGSYARYTEPMPPSPSRSTTK